MFGAVVAKGAISVSARVLFLCTGNACRSQMAEGWARALARPDLEILSAGIEAHGLNPSATKAMKEAGVDISHQQSTLIHDVEIRTLDIVITVCGHADEACPVLPPSVLKRHWPLSDPARATGDAAKVEAVFRASRDDIKARVVDLLEEFDWLAPSA
jgi:arsenate reductase